MLFTFVLMKFMLTRSLPMYAKVLNISDDIEIVLDEIFIETAKLEEDYHNALFITNEASNFNPLLILNKKLYQDIEDIHSFVPTYLRSGV